MGITTRGLRPVSLRSWSQKGAKRQILGSLRTGRLEPSNSDSNRSLARRLNATASPESNQDRVNRRQSSQEEPAEANNSSFSAIIGVDSKKPRSFQGAAGIKFFGARPPSLLRTPATALVPLRCMPRTRIGSDIKTLQKIRPATTKASNTPPRQLQKGLASNQSRKGLRSNINSCPIGRDFGGRCRRISMRLAKLGRVP